MMFDIHIKSGILSDYRYSSFHTVLMSRDDGCSPLHGRESFHTLCVISNLDFPVLACCCVPSGNIDLVLRSSFSSKTSMR